MSGGSWDYVYCKLDEAAEKLCHSRRPNRRALGAKMKQMSAAMHDIEWVDSGDCGPGDEDKAIKLALGEAAPLLIANEVIAEAKGQLAALKAALVDLEAQCAIRKR
jgi:hypothetical protein